jgi:hypothetical protein
MVIRTPSELRTNMPIGQPAGIVAQDIHDLIDTLEERTTQGILRKTASYTATAADNQRIIVFNSASGVTLTLPNTLPEGWECGILQMGAGQVTVSVAGSPPISRGNHSRTAGQFAQASVFVESNSSGTAAVVILSGDTAA